MTAIPSTTDMPVLLPPVQGLAVSWVDGGWNRLPQTVFRPAVAVGIVAAFALSVAIAEAATDAPRFDVIGALWKWAPLMFQGFLFNLAVSFLSMGLGTLAGIPLGLAQVSLLAPVRRGAWLTTQFFRNAPWLVLLFYCMFLLPFEVSVFGVTIPLPGWAKAVVGLALPVMANVAEVVRGGVQSIPSGQWESAEALAFTRTQTLWMVILPQCIKRMTPPWMNLYAILTMATTLISVIGIQEGMTMTRAALVAEGRTELFIPMYLMLLGWFFLYCYPIARWTLRLERRFRVIE